MYVQKQFEEQRVEKLHELVRSYPLATVVTLSSDGLNANHIPLHLEIAGKHGLLRGHIARANPMLHDLASGVESLAIFHGPNAYITPSWYATKKESGRVVPTWNFAVVHAYGVIRVVDNAQWLRTQLESLTAHNEAKFDEPWLISDAPDDYIEKTMAVIVGVEMEITKLVGKWKVSQNQPMQNRISVSNGLRESDAINVSEMAMLVDAASADIR